MKSIPFIINTILIIALIPIKSCDHIYDRTYIIELLNSKDIADNMEAYFIIGETKDISFINEVLKDPYNPHVTVDLRFKGMSLYYTKMGALRKITGVSPPKRVNYEPDSLVVKFYFSLLKERGLIK